MNQFHVRQSNQIGAELIPWLPEVYSWELMSRFVKRNKIPLGRISFFRHGQTYLNRKKLNSGKLDCPLTARGRTAAAKLADEIPLDFSYVFSSPLSRSIETMEIAFDFARRKPAHVILDERLEEKSLGVLEGKPRTYIPEFDEGNLNYAPKGGESYRDLGQRCLSFIIDLQSALISAPTVKPSVIIVFTHMGPLRVFSSFFGRTRSAKEMMAGNFSNLHGFQADFSEFKIPDFFLEGTKKDGRGISTTRGISKIRT